MRGMRQWRAVTALVLLGVYVVWAKDACTAHSGGMNVTNLLATLPKRNLDPLTMTLTTVPTHLHQYHLLSCTHADRHTPCTFQYSPHTPGLCENMTAVCHCAGPPDGTDAWEVAWRDEFGLHVSADAVHAAHNSTAALTFFPVGSSADASRPVWALFPAVTADECPSTPSVAPNITLSELCANATAAANAVSYHCPQMVAMCPPLTNLTTLCASISAGARCHNHGVSSNFTCAAFLAGTEPQDWGLSAAGDDMALYFASLGVYAMGGILLAVVSFAVPFLLCVARFCCCCIARGGACGGRAPTMSSGRCWGVGYNVKKWMVNRETKERWKYPDWSRRLSRCCMITYVAATVFAVAVGIQGGTNFVAGVEHYFLETPDLWVGVGRRSVGSWAFAIKDINQDVLQSTLNLLRSKVMTPADPTVLASATDGMMKELHFGIENAVATFELTELLQEAETRASSIIDVDMYPTIRNLTANLDALVPLIEYLRRNMTYWDALTDEIQSTGRDVELRLAQAEAMYGKFVTPGVTPAEVAFRLESTSMTLPQIPFVRGIVGPTTTAPDAEGNTTALCAPETTPGDVTTTPWTTCNFTANGTDLITLINGGMSGPSASARWQREQLLGQLLDVKAAFDSTINIQETRDVLDVFKAHVDEAYGLDMFFPSYQAQVEDMLNDTAAILPFDVYNASVWALPPQFDGLQRWRRLHHDAIKLRTVRRTRYSDRELAIIPDQQALIANESYLLAQYATIRAQSTLLNTSAMWVPDCFNQIEALRVELEPVLDTFLELTGEFQANFTRAAAVWVAEDPTMIAINQDVLWLLRRVKDAFDYAELEARVGPVYPEQAQLQLAQSLAVARRIHPALANPNVTWAAADVDQYQQLYDNTEGTRDTLALGIDSLVEFSKARCDTFGKVGSECEIDLECLGGTCLAGLHRCRRNFLLECQHNSECPPGDTCLFHQPTFELLASGLVEYTAIGRPDPQDQIDAMRVLDEALVDETATDPAVRTHPTNSSARLGRLLDVMDPIDFSAEMPQLDAYDRVISYDGSTVLDVPSWYNSLAAMLAATRSIDPGPSLEASDDWNQAVEMVLNGTAAMAECDVWADNLNAWWVVELGALLPQLEAQQVDTLIDNVGLNAALDLTADAVDGLLNWTRTNCDVHPPFLVKRDLEFLRQRFEAVSAAVFTDTGALNQWASLVFSDAPYRFIPIQAATLELDARGGSVFRDRFGALWPPHPGDPNTNNTRLCLGRDCVANSLQLWRDSMDWGLMGLDYVMAEAVWTATTEDYWRSDGAPYDAYVTVRDTAAAYLGDSSDEPQIKMGRDQFQVTMFMFPLLVALAGLAGAAACHPACGKRWQRWPAVCTAVFLAFLMPLAFYMAIAVWLPAIVAVHDTCASVEVVGQQWVAGSLDYLCYSWLDGVALDGPNCTVQVLDYDISINIERAYAEFAFGCPDPDVEGAVPSELQRVYDQVGAIMRVLPDDQYQATMADFGFVCHPQPSLKGNLLTGVDAAAGILRTLFTDSPRSMGEPAYVTCDVIHDALIGAKDDACCATLSAVTWHTCAWVLVAMSGLCCGFPASVLGFKRFPIILWGPGFDQKGRYDAKNLEKKDSDEEILFIDDEVGAGGGSGGGGGAESKEDPEAGGGGKQSGGGGGKGPAKPPPPPPSKKKSRNRIKPLE